MVKMRQLLQPHRPWIGGLNWVIKVEHSGINALKINLENNENGTSQANGTSSDIAEV